MSSLWAMHLPDTIARIRPHIVQISVSGPTFGENPVILGTGFLVSGLEVVTANHVVNAATNMQSTHPHLAVGIGLPDFTDTSIFLRAGRVSIPSDVVDTYPEDDIALLKLRVDPGAEWFESTADINGTKLTVRTEPVELDARDVKDGMAVATSGFPLNSQALVTTTGVVASYWSVDTPTNPRTRILIDLTANGGNSGGPVYDINSGAVVGVLVAGKLAPATGATGIATAAGLTIAVPTRAIVELLSKNGITPPMRPPAGARTPRGRPKGARG